MLINDRLSTILTQHAGEMAFVQRSQISTPPASMVSGVRLQQTAITIWINFIDCTMLSLFMGRLRIWFSPMLVLPGLKLAKNQSAEITKTILPKADSGPDFVMLVSQQDEK